MSLRADEFDYIYPESLIATEPRENFRILFTKNIGANADGAAPREISKNELFALFNPGDVLVINNTRVERRRIFTKDGLEILFCEPVSGMANEMADEPRQPKGMVWRVLFTARDLKVGAVIDLPGDSRADYSHGLKAELVAKGLPQTIRLNAPIDANYFEQYGDLALPPYIQKARGERQSREQDTSWYQTAWANRSGSQAAPTASLHFTNSDLQTLREKGVVIAPLTLHVGIGTFLPVKTEFLDDHKMHREYVEIPAETVEQIMKAKATRGVANERSAGQARPKIWALGTTVVRSLESWAVGKLAVGKLATTAPGNAPDGNATAYFGETDLFIRPGYKYEVVDALLTNFHQPHTTLLALVAAFAGKENMLRSYEYAIKNQFRLFSYGDLSVWMRE